MEVDIESQELSGHYIFLKLKEMESQLESKTLKVESKPIQNDQPLEVIMESANEFSLGTLNLKS